MFHSVIYYSISGSKSAVNLDYVTHLRDKISLPLVRKGLQGIPEALDVMHTYNLLREDLDNIVELSQWPKGRNPMNLVDSKVWFCCILIQFIIYMSLIR